MVAQKLSSECYGVSTTACLPTYAVVMDVQTNLVSDTA